MTDDQRGTIAFLADPRSYGLAEPVKRIDTHAAHVFLAGPDVYKLKRAVRFPFMDLSTLDRRRAVCEAEVAVNRRYAPDLYLGTVPVVRRGGRLALGGAGEIIDWTVHLRRFDETRTLDLVADRGELGEGIIASLAAEIAAVHGHADRCAGSPATAALGGVVDETVDELVAAPEIFAGEEAARFAAAMRREFARLRPLLLARGEAGAVRRCHGDLHLRNIAMIAGQPTLFDAIEFDESIATIDILYDLAFILMDLWERGLRAEANLLFNRYLWLAPEPRQTLAGLAALPLFLALRAAVRAKVDALRHAASGDAAARDSARRYFAAAAGFLAPAHVHLIAFGGLSGVGKTTVARLAAPRVGRAPGAVHLRSDIERKRHWGVGEHDRLPDAAYARAVTAAVFAEIRDYAEAALAAGHSVIADTVHRLRDERDAIRAVATRTGAAFTGLWLTAPVDVLLGRVADRSGDASDATAEIVLAQAASFHDTVEWITLDAGGSLEEVADAALATAGILRRQA